MSKLESLKNADSISDLAALLGYKAKTLSYIIYKIPNELKYVEFSIKKKNGEDRIILSPTLKLKKLQRRLADLLNECDDEIHNNFHRNKRIAHGFVKKHSIITNATNHKNKRYVFNCDLKDFFPSINFGRVRGFFIKNNNFNLNEKISTIIAQIVCYNNSLPQGSPSSPIISNLIGHILDIRLVNLAKVTNCTYSRYADDLTFSTNKRDFPNQIAIQIRDNHWTVGKVLAKEIKRCGFEVNSKKISLQYKISRQTTTGLVVNKKVNVKREYYKTARSMCHELFNTDKFYLSKQKTISDNNSKSDETTIFGSLKQLEGILSFINHINKPKDDRELAYRQYKPTGLIKLTRQFLFYKNFYALDKPMIICEGKTDIVYIKSALRSLRKSYNSLITQNDVSIRFKIGFFNFSNFIKKSFEISTGTSGIKQLINIYDSYLQTYKGNGMRFPVIIIIDNDDGSRKIKSTIREKLKSQIDFVSEKKFYNICGNLFILFATEEQDTEIEDLFEEKVLKTQIDGKSFNKKSEISTQTEYGKHIFAEKVVKLNQEKINFNNFKPLLNKLTTIVENYVKLRNN